MADKAFRNVINGELVDAASGETYDILDPTTGEVYATAPKSGKEDLDRAYASWRTRSRRASTRSTRSSARTPASRSG